MLTIEEVARICHEANRAYCIGIGDNSQPSWDDAPEWQKESAMDGVVYHVAHPDSPPSASHTNWLKKKESEGWVYGAVKNPENKEHPCMVPFEALPPAQQYKDILFTAIVRSLMGILVVAK